MYIYARVLFNMGYVVTNTSKFLIAFEAVKIFNIIVRVSTICRAITLPNGGLTFCSKLIFKRFSTGVAFKLQLFSQAAPF